MRRTLVGMVFVGTLVTSAWAANLDTLQGMEKQAGKVGAPSLDLGASQAKALCICHLPGGSSRLGFVFQFATSTGPQRVQIECNCGIPTYDQQSGVRTDAFSCDELGGQFWEIVK